MRERLTVHQKFYLQQVRAATAVSLEAEFDRQVLAHGIEGVVPEYQFHSERKWRLDRAIPHLKIAVEIQGGFWTAGHGGHTSPKGLQRDIDKSNALQEAGWLCAYMSADMVKDGRGVMLFKRFIELRREKI